jgi:hypothetical protein
MCSVRHSPIPSREGRGPSRASAGRVGIGAHADVAHRVGPAHQRREAPVQRGFLISAAPASTSPGRAVDGDDVALAEARARPVRQPLCRGSSARSEAPTTQGTPRPRAITAAWLVMPPRSVSTPRRHACRGCPRAGFAPHKDAGLAARGLACAAVGGKHDPAGRRARGWPAMPRASTSRAPGIDLAVQQLGQRARRRCAATPRPRG